MEAGLALESTEKELSLGFIEVAGSPRLVGEEEPNEHAKNGCRDALNSNVSRWKGS